MKPLSHVYVANAVINDVRANAGQVRIGSLGLFSIRPEYRAVMLDERYAPYVRAGAVGPDAFPSLLTGQTQIHTFTDKWLAYVDSRMHTTGTSETAMANNAFFAGYLTHICADMWTHDWVNQYSGGPWPSLSNLATPLGARNVAIHLAIETILDDNTAKVKDSFKVDIKVPTNMMVDLMINTRRVPVLADNETWQHDISCARFLEDGFARKYWYTEQYLGASAANPVSSYLKAWHNDIKNGLIRWVNAHEKAVSRHLTTGEDLFRALQTEWTEWAKWNLLSMYGAPDVLVKLPVAIAQAIDFNIPFVEEIKQKIKDNIRDYICRQAFGMTYNELIGKISPAGLSLLINNATVYNKIISECGNIPRLPQLTVNSNPIFWNSVVFAKIAMMSPAEQQRLARLCGNQNPPSYNLPFGVMSIDGTGQYRCGNMGSFTDLLLNNNTLRHFDPARVRSQQVEPRDNRRQSSVVSTLKSVSVRVKTADKLFAGTDADIYFGLNFRNGTKKEWLLDHDFYNDLERGDNDWYHFFTGMPSARREDIQSVFLRMANTKGAGPDWECASIIVCINGGPHRSFTVNTKFTRAGATWTGAV